MPNEPLNKLARSIFRDSVRKGWMRGELTAANMIVELAKVHGEVSEAVDCVERQQLEMWLDGPEQKPMGLPAELADIVIHLLAAAQYFGVDLDAAVATKRAYNKKREVRHGKVI